MAITVTRNRKNIPEKAITAPFTASIKGARIPKDATKFNCATAIGEFKPDGVFINSSQCVEHRRNDVIHYVQGTMFKLEAE